MLRYVGGKTRFAKEFAHIFAQHKKPQHEYYIEPFVGGASVFAEMHDCGLKRFGCDINADLIAFYRALQEGWLPPEQITEDEYKRLKTAPSSPLRTYAGFAASWGGKWWGGYARCEDNKGNVRSVSEEGYRRIVKAVPKIQDTTFLHKDYQTIKASRKQLIYCDPPYQATMGYNVDFDHDTFFETMREWARKGATVLISEYNAPSDFACVWSKQHFVSTSLKAERNVTTECLFTYKGE